MGRNTKPTQRRNTAHDDMVLARREKVATLRNRNLSLRDIQQALASPVEKGGIRNPETGKPYDLATIQRDLVAIRKQQAETANEAMEQHRARELAEIFELKRVAWANKDYHLVLSALDREIKLLGTAAPQVIKLSISLELVEKVIVALEAANMDPTAIFNQLIAEAERRRQLAG